MADPFSVLGLPSDSDDEAIRRRYLELVRQFTPEHHPERFAAVRAAYEQLRDLNTRLRYRLFEGRKKDALDAILEGLLFWGARRRVSLQALLEAVRKP